MSGGFSGSQEWILQIGSKLVRNQDCGVSGTKARRPGLDSLMADARRRKFSIVLVAAFDRVAWSVRHFLQVIESWKVWELFLFHDGNKWIQAE